MPRAVIKIGLGNRAPVIRRRIRFPAPKSALFIKVVNQEPESGPLNPVFGDIRYNNSFVKQICGSVEIQVPGKSLKVGWIQPDLLIAAAALAADNAIENRGN